MYIYGFPCKPFSSLRTKSRAFAERAARPFAAVLKTLVSLLPAIAILENVGCIQRDLDKVWRRLRALRWYEVLTVHIDPADMGETECRSRYYFILVRVDVAKNDLDERAGMLLSAGHRVGRRTLAQRQVRDSSPHVALSLIQI